MKFLCPACRTPLPVARELTVVPCSECGVEVDLTRVDTAPGTARLWPELELTGERLGEFVLVRRIGAGGMGAVYEGEGPTGPCAVKVLSALLAAEPGLRTRFRREAAALRAIEHPGVVRILAEGEERGFCWYAMERIDGVDLRQRLLSGPLAVEEVEALAVRLLEALGVVHGTGLTHRDVKPGNILLASSGPKLCDFGIARFDGSTTLTESAALMGSLRYMAPEQRLGRAGPTSDLYALGMVLHECLAGGVPGEKALPPGVPRRLRRLVERLLRERPDERVGSAQHGLRLLRPASTPQQRRAGLAALTVAALMLPGYVWAPEFVATWRDFWIDRSAPNKVVREVAPVPVEREPQAASPAVQVKEQVPSDPAPQPTPPPRFESVAGRWLFPLPPALTDPTGRKGKIVPTAD